MANAAARLTVNFQAQGPPTAARLATLAGDGFLHITADSWLSTVIPELVSINAGQGRIRIRDVLFLLLDSVITHLADELYTDALGWSLLPTTITALLVALDATGSLDWQPAATVEEACDKLRAAAEQLPLQVRTFQTNGICF